MKAVVFLAAVAVFAAAQAAGPVGDIVWPDYALVAKPHDAELSCPALQAEIDRVAADIDRLEDAKFKAEDAMRVVRDMRSPTGLALADTSSIRTGGKGVEYAEVRHRIKESLRIAKARHEHLMSLVPSCRPS